MSGSATSAARAAAEAEAQHGHDLVMLLAPPALHEDQVIDHREIYEECERRYGPAPDFAIKSTYNPKTGKYFGFCNAFLPALMIYRKDLWDAVGASPDSWDDVRRGGRQIKLLHDSPVGISLAPEHNSNHTVRAIMYSFGASVQDADGNPALKSKATLEAINYVKALYQEAMTEDVLTWDAASNNSFIVAGDGCMTLDTISIARASENTAAPVREGPPVGHGAGGPGRPACALVRDLHLLHLGLRGEHRGRQAVPRRLHRAYPPGLPRERLPEHAGLPGGGARPRGRGRQRCRCRARRTSTAF